MNFYKEQIVPLLINMAMRQQNLAAYRSRVVPAAEGRVIEIGIGSGLNLPFYSRNVEHIIGLDPSLKLLLMARRHPQPEASPVKLVEGSAEAIPFGNPSADTGRDDVDVVQHFRCRARAHRDTPGAQTRWAPSLCRTWPCSRAKGALVARPTDPRLEAPERWLSSQPCD